MNRKIINFTTSMVCLFKTRCLNTKLMQFTKGTYKDAQLEKIYFAGLETYEEDMLMSTISSNLSIETSL